MTTRRSWTRRQLLAAFSLYCRLPFGKLHYRNPEIVRVAEAIGRTPSALAMKLVNIASLDPAITSTGRKGLPGASAADRAMWEEMQADWAAFAIESGQALREVGLLPDTDDGAIPDAETDIAFNHGRTGEDRLIEATARIGQGFFRSAVLSAYNERCCITGLAEPQLLVASHIVPWSVDRANRVNPRNGLLLSSLHDRVFDIGLITLNDDLTVRVSSRHNAAGGEFFEAAISRYAGQPIHRPDKFAPAPEFLAWHRAQVFRG